ncbi:MAG: Sec-independent protein translocase subunit TatA [Micrococcales bacterium]|uniref:Sec-independent protein translocase subunit TatA n=1 Tax=Phycicoccus sp. TaxID=1902410 RepID=UPI001996ABD5|nr:Sec-independent protein translocase subunit TatA [Phycicoccus sp.]MBD3783623.1 Sec-independent protein translocase subunit TatA [Micrococcales bacterium]HMM96322.1 Sec-independent protein translocase subunit TatA [Phycicoccus sp.]
MRGLFEGWHLIILLVIVIALFGAKRLPDAARSLGRSMRVFRSEVDEMKKEHEAGKSEASSETVRGESITRDRAVDDVVTPDPQGNAVHERAPRTDNQSGPAA